MKPSNYVIQFRRSDELILYSTATGYAAKIKNSELAASIEDVFARKLPAEGLLERSEPLYSDLLKYRIIIPDDYDEAAAAAAKAGRVMDTLDELLRVIIIPTRQCNFDCPYCYEKHENKSMDSAVYDRLLEFTKQTYEDGSYRGVMIDWFGGEPTLEADNIHSFMARINRWAEQSGVPVGGSMTTNGFLLTPELFSEFVSEGIRSFQITVDGTEESHDQTRVLAGGQPTWKKIISNLEYAHGSSLDFNIIVRTNFSVLSYEHYREWIDYLALKFGGDARFSYHFETVKDLGGENKELVFGRKEAMRSIYAYCAERHLALKSMRSMLRPGRFVCYAAKPSSYLVDHDGSIKKCTVALERPSNTVGMLGPEGAVIDRDRLSSWTDYELEEQCIRCPIYPQCMGKKCPSSYFSEKACNTYRELFEDLLYSMI